MEAAQRHQKNQTETKSNDAVNLSALLQMKQEEAEKVRYVEHEGSTYDLGNSHDRNTVKKIILDLRVGHGPKRREFRRWRKKK